MFAIILSCPWVCPSSFLCIVLNVVCLQHTFKPCTKINMFDPATKLLCAIGEICGVLGMTFHGNIIAPGHYIIVVINIKKGSMKLPFPNLGARKVNNMGNGIVLWREKNLVPLL